MKKDLLDKRLRCGLPIVNFAGGTLDEKAGAVYSQCFEATIDLVWSLYYHELRSCCGGR